MGREEGEGLRRDGWIRFDRIAKTWVSTAYKMHHLTAQDRPGQRMLEITRR